MRFIFVAIFVGSISVVNCQLPKEIACHSPNCSPPGDVGCKAYKSQCTKDRRKLAVTPAQCGCLWKAFIQSVEPQSKVIFTEQGRQCFTWATQICHKLAVPSAYGHQSVILSVIQLLKKLETDPPQHYGEVVKSRRRPALNQPIFATPRTRTRKAARKKPRKHKSSRHVENKTHGQKWWLLLGPNIRFPSRYNTPHDGNVFIGAPNRKHSRGGGQYTIRAERGNGAGGQYRIRAERKNVKKVKPTKQGKTNNKGHPWFVFNLNSLPDEQFKLAVFVVILILNILCVVFTILCRKEARSSSKEARPSGDLNPDVYKTPPDNQEKPKNKMRSFRKFFARLFRKKKKQTNSMKYFDIDSDKQDLLLAPHYPQTFSATKGTNQDSESSGLYENLQEDSFDLDLTYEDPVAATRKMLFKQYSSSPGTSDDDTLHKITQQAQVAQELDELYSTPNRPSQAVPRIEEQNKSVTFELPHRHSLVASTPKVQEGEQR